MDPARLPDASEIVRLLVRREMSASEHLEANLSRIAALNPALCAVVALDAESARRAARESDARLAAGQARPLEGLAITIKDAFDVAGIVSTSGAKPYAARVPEKDAAAVARLREAGAVIVGKSNVPAFCGDFQAFNAIYGTTNNPYDLDRSPGGSSGGAAAATATGMSDFELGSDIGGSTRWPAHACGLFGLKPTQGLVPTLGHVPPPPGTRSESDLLVAGPLARSARDLDLVLAVLGGNAVEPASRRDPAGLRVALWASDEFAAVDTPVREASEHAARLLAQAGATIDASARPAFDFAKQFEVFALINHAMIAAGLKPEQRERLAAQAQGFAPDDRSHRALQARGARLDPIAFKALREKRAAFREAWDAFFRDFDVVLCPPAPVAAIPHDQRPNFHDRTLRVNGDERPYFDFLIWSSLATLSGLPAAVAPVSRTPEGLPVGVQIIAAHGADRTAIGVAALLEERGCRFDPPDMARS